MYASASVRTRSLRRLRAASTTGVPHCPLLARPAQPAVEPVEVVDNGRVELARGETCLEQRQLRIASQYSRKGDETDVNIVVRLLEDALRPQG